MSGVMRLKILRNESIRETTKVGNFFKIMPVGRVSGKDMK